MVLYESKVLAEQSALNLRCSGVKSARVIKITAYKVVTNNEKEISPIIEVK